MKRRLLCLMPALVMALLTGCALARPVRESAGADRWVGYYMVYEPREAMDAGSASGLRPRGIVWGEWDETAQSLTFPDMAGSALLMFGREDERITVHWEHPIQDIFVAGEKFAHLKGKKLNARELASLPLIMLEQKANSRLYVQRFFLRKGIELKPEIELASYELMGELARINLGLSCMVWEFCGEELSGGKVFALELSDPIPPRSVGMVSLRGVSLSPAASKFLELLRSME